MLKNSIVIRILMIFQRKDKNPRKSMKNIEYAKSSKFGLFQVDSK